MNLGDMDLKELADIIKTISELSPLADALVPAVESLADTIFKFTPTLKRLTEAAGDYQVQRNIKVFNDLLNGGFSREEALAVLLANQLNVIEVMNKMKSK